MSKSANIAFIGAGRAATALGVALATAGYDIVAIASRRERSATDVAGAINRIYANEQCEVVSTQVAINRAGLVFLTIPDAVIGQIAKTQSWHEGQTVVHCSGALGLQELEPARQQGARVGSLHPFQTLTGNSDLSGSTFGIEADSTLFDTLADMARSIGGIALSVPSTARPLYHAASVLACGYLTTLLREARRVWEAAGLSESSGRLAIAAVASSTLEHVIAEGEAATVTGPVSRGDLETVRLHLESIKQAAPELLALYTAISRRSVLLDEEAGRSSISLEEWDELYKSYSGAD